MFNRDRYLVTGGAGFIGINLVELLLLRGDEVCVIDNMSYAANPEIHNMNCGLVIADICDINIVRQTLRCFRPTHILHLAAESHVDNSIADATAFVHTNIEGTHVLLSESMHYMQARQYHDKDFKLRFVYMSTDEVYGDLPLGEGFFTEDSPYNPSSPYSSSKAAADMLVKSFIKTHGFPAIITHCSNNYGPYQHEEKLIPKLIRKLCKSEEFPLYGDGLNERDWIYVDDHIKGFLRAADEGKIGEVYNFGANTVYSNIDVIDKICNTINIDKNKYIRFVKDRKGHDRRYAIDATKAKKKLKWEPRVSFEEGIKRTIGWYEKNKNWR